jgi:hypothetical protein
LLEASPDEIARNSTLLPAQAATALVSERNATHQLAETYSIPLYTVTNSYAPHTQVLEQEILPFLRSLDLSDAPELSQELPYAQEIQCCVHEIDLGVQQEMEAYLRQEVGDRVQCNWETWAGIYFTPPLDEPSWTEDEFRRIVFLLTQHPNVFKVDVPIQGTQGMAKSTR